MSKKIYILGDIQFKSEDWYKELELLFLNWFGNYDFGKVEDCTLIQLGDVTERGSNTGDVIDRVTRFADLCMKKFNQTYIITGNHDLKTFKGNETTTIQFLSNFGNIKIIDSECVKEINNHKILFLPFRKIKDMSIEKYYSECLDSSIYEDEYELICGHVALKDKNSFIEGIEIEKFSAKHYAFGHIHNRYGKYKSYYTGSYAPLKIGEVNQEGHLPRCIKCIDEIGNETKIDIPEFVKYESVVFPEKLEYKKWSDQIVHIYTIRNGGSLMKAISHYGDEYYIKGVERVIKQEDMNSDVEKVTHFESNLEAFNSMMKDSNVVISRSSAKYLREILAN